MSALKNIFLIGRKGHEGDENQLTEMLAWLLQQEAPLVPAWLESLGIDAEDGDWVVETQRAVPGGFVDLVLHLPGRAIVVFESKLGSTTDYAQITKYVEYLRSVPVAGTRALVFSTQHPESWPRGVDVAAGDDVQLIMRRWQALGDFLRSTDSPGAHDFVAMLEKEGLVTPDALARDDWEAWQRGNEVTRRLARLVNEAAGGIQRLEPAFSKSGAVTLSNNGLLYRLFRFAEASCGVGFWPTRKPPRPEDHAAVVVYVLNTALPESERRSAGRAAVERAASRAVAMSDWSEHYLQHSTPAHEVLTAADFDRQVEQLVEHVASVLAYFREDGYLTMAPDQDLGQPARPSEVP